MRWVIGSFLFFFCFCYLVLLPRAEVNCTGSDNNPPVLTTQQGVAIEDDNNSLKAGVTGPTLLEDFILREKLTHFDHERIPERVVHAHGTGAKGYFQVYTPMTQYTSAAFLKDPSIKTPVFVRFSTFQGNKGSADTVRDVRGFATKFYTTEGNFDIVGNNIPIFFIQDAIKFPDFAHSAKPEPKYEIPQGATAHNNFYDFISLMPETIHMILWVFSDRALPRSFAMMEGFGVNTYRFINSQGNATFIKWFWRPQLGVHSFLFDEASQIAGKDPDYHRRDLVNRLEAGYPVEYELGVQLIPQNMVDQWGFDLLDATKLVPEELVPVTPVGRMVLNQYVDNFFAETEQVAFCVANLVPGIDFSEDPLLQGRAFSYLDTQLLRLGGPNFHEIPVNRPIVSVQNFQQDGHMQVLIPNSNVNYEPNSLGAGCPVMAAMNGNQRQPFVTYPTPVSGTKIRERSPTFSNHYGQAILFWNSLSPIEQMHVIDAAKFELGKVTVREVQERMVAQLNNVNDTLAQEVAIGLGLTPPTPLSNYSVSASGGINSSAPLSQSNTTSNSTEGLTVAILIANGFNNSDILRLQAFQHQNQIFIFFISPTLGSISSSTGETVPANDSFITASPVLYDAVFIPGGNSSMQNSMNSNGLVPYFIQQQFKHCKTIGASGEGVNLLRSSNVPLNSTGVVTDQTATGGDVFTEFITQMQQVRHFARQLEPEYAAFPGKGS